MLMHIIFIPVRVLNFQIVELTSAITANHSGDFFRLRKIYMQCDSYINHFLK